MQPNLLSIVIPSRNERFLVPTVNDLLAKATGPIEIIVVLDGGEWPASEPLPYDKVALVRHPESLGTRAAINAGVEMATGEFIMKSDAHCLYAPGFDEILKKHCSENVVAVPRRRRLDAENWKIEETRRPDIDYEYLSFYPSDFGGWTHNIKRWEEKNRDESLRSEIVSDIMCFQASCYMMTRSTFHALDLMDESTYGALMSEGEEIALKCWTSQGRVIVVKDTYYCHLYKGNRYGRGYELNMDEVRKGAAGVRKWLTNSAWPGKQILPFHWWIEKFWPLPGWPDDWKEQLNYHE